MSALSVFSLVLVLPLAFLLHNGEELAVQHRWMQAHRAELATRFPRLRPLVAHLSRLSTRAFAVAAMEEFVLLLVVTAYVLQQGPYCREVWVACFMAFAFHLCVHVGQAVLVRGYVPGLATTILLLPYVAYGCWSVWLSMGVAQWLALTACGVVVLMVNLALAHRLGLMLQGRRDQGDRPGQTR